MGHGKETPRQKMIGMMYLFLTAMLALNVSKDVLNAFTLVDKSLQETTKNFVEKNESIYADFAAAFIENKEKVGPWKAKADSVKMQADSLVGLIQEYKELIVKTADGPEYDMDDISGKDNLDVPAQVMMVEKGGERSQDLKQAIAGFRKYLKSIVDTSAVGIRQALESSLDTSDPEMTGHSKGEQTSWASHHFEHLPLSGVVTLMSKMQSDVRNSEADVVSYLYRQIEAGSFKFNKLEAIVKSNSDYVMKGGTFEADVFLAASDTTVDPEVYVGGQKLNVVEGKGKFTRPATGVGPQTFSGKINYKGPDGNVLTFPFESQYTVGEPSLVVSPTKMNVFYTGVENPVDISVSGVPQSRVRTSITPHGTLRQAGNGYVAVVRRNQDVQISASVEMEDGSVKNMGVKKFRVRPLPPPDPKVAGKRGGRIARNELAAQIGVTATLDDFLFNAKFTVTEFSVEAYLQTGNYARELTNGNRFTQKQKQIIKRAAGSVNIIVSKYKGPDGVERELNRTIRFRI